MNSSSQWLMAQRAGYFSTGIRSGGLRTSAGFREHLVRYAAKISFANAWTNSAERLNSNWMTVSGLRRRWLSKIAVNQRWETGS